MKKLSTISLFIFGIVITSIFTAGLVFYQNNKVNKNSPNTALANDNLVKDTFTEKNLKMVD